MTRVILRAGFSMVTILIMLSACEKPQADLTAHEKAGIVREVTQTLNDYYAAIREKGLTAEFNYLDSSENFFWVPPGSAISLSYDSVYKILHRNAPLYRSINNSWDTLRVQPLTPEYVTYTGVLTSVMTDTSGMIMTFRLAETGVMVKRKTAWKLLSGQTTLINR